MSDIFDHAGDADCFPCGMHHTSHTTDSTGEKRMRNLMCMKCELCHKAKCVCLWGEGKRGTIMLVSGAATYADSFAGRPLWGEAGDLLDHILFKLGYGREDLYVTSLLKCSPGKAGLPKGKKIKPLVEACMPYLQEEIAEINPKVIVPMGSLAVQALAGITFISRADGYPIQQEARWIVPCHHPSAALQAPSLEKNIAMALAKAFELAGLPVKSRGQGSMYDYKEMGGID